MGDVIASGDAAPGVEALVSMFDGLLASTRGSFGLREQAALQMANELVRRWYGRELGRMAECYGDEVRVAGNAYRRHEVGVKRYHTLCGAVDVRRATYRLVGVHNGPTVVPLELEAGIVENATPALAFSVTQGFAERPLRHYEAEMAGAHRAVPSRSTLERIGKRVGQRVRDALPLVEVVVRTSEPVPETTRSISVGLDRTTVPMAEPTDRPTHRTRPYVRRPPPPISVAYRMAYVGTVALHDENGMAVKTSRLGSTAGGGPR